MQKNGSSAKRDSTSGAALYSAAEPVAKKRRANVDESATAKEGEGETALEGVHPYGLKPQGNQHYSSDKNILDISLGKLRALEDSCVHHVLSMLSAKELGRLAMVSKSLYMFSHDSKLWREHVLSATKGDFRFTGNWKETYLTHVLPAGSHAGHTPLQISNCYSDFLYQPWISAAVAIDPAWLTTESVDRREGLTVEEFIEKYEKPGIPVIFTDVIPKWTAAKEWTPERLLAKYGDKKFNVSATVKMTMKDFFHYESQAREERPLYLFDKDFAKTCPEMNDQYDMPPYFAEDLMRHVGQANRPDYRWLIIGPARSGSNFHVDPNCNFAWNATIAGSKKWILYPPHVTPPSVMPRGPDGAYQQAEVSLIQWMLAHYDSEDEANSKRLECITKAGELMYVPRGWWHCVLNLEATVALTHNVVTERNLLKVTDFLEQSAPCETGKGCRGGDGDVPTSVIYPYPEKDEGTVQVVAGEVCECMRRKQTLLQALKDGLDKERPGCLQALLDERKAKEEQGQSFWYKMHLPLDQAPTTSFSFGF